MSNHLLHDVLLLELFVERAHVAACREYTEYLVVPARDLFPVAFPSSEETTPGAPEPVGAPCVAARQGYGTEHLESRESKPDNVETRLVLVAETRRGRRLLRPIKAHHEGAGRPIATIACHVCLSPFHGPGFRIHGQAEIDEPERGTTARVLHVKAGAEASAFHRIAQEDIARVNIAVPSMWSDSLQCRPQLPQKLRRQCCAASDCGGPILSGRRRALQEGVQGLPRHARHGHAHPPARFLLLHSMSEVARNAHHRRPLPWGHNGQILEALQNVCLQDGLLQVPRG
mmetsp:Transcript_76790/g.172173  ORF Transcript_76790/g.172173 Transcript_76790/m.172173 type:complete len:286 (+) Transcript_76790:433-1290(+)